MQYYNNLITSVEKTSDDIHTQIGCVITAKDGHILSMGTNKFTAGITATAENVQNVMQSIQLQRTASGLKMPQCIC
jgi:deoxycytidylate deaminase